MPLTKNESECLKDFIREQITTDWVSMNYQKQYINLGGVARIEDKIDELTKK